MGGRANLPLPPSVHPTKTVSEKIELLGKDSARRREKRFSLTRNKPFEVFS
jgi:hypothetical protein